MKLLLVGFTTQHAAALTMLVNRNYPGYQVHTIERVFCDNLRLCLPALDAIHQDAVAVIINLDGVGMIRCTQAHKEQLEAFIQHRAVILIARTDFEEWQKIQVVESNRIVFVRAPYDKDSINAGLNHLFAIIPNIKSTSTTPTTSGVASITGQITTNIPKVPSAGLQSVLEEYFDSAYHALFENLLLASLSVSPIKVKIGTQIFYVNRLKNVALVTDRERLLKYAESLQGFQTVKMLQVEKVGHDEFDALFANNAYKKHALDTLLWQIYDYLLPETISTNRGGLSLKLKYMPNLTGINISETEKEILWLCLAYKKDLSTLLETYRNQITEEQLNRLILILLMTGIADSTGLEDHHAVPTAKLVATQNEGVQKAKSTGFLGRLIKALKGA